MENKRALFALQAKDLSVGRRGQALLSGVNFTLQPGSSLAVIGESGCGKTTLLQTLAGVLPAVAGDVSCRSSESAAKPVNAGGVNTANFSDVNFFFTFQRKSDIASVSFFCIKFRH